MLIHTGTHICSAVTSVAQKATRPVAAQLLPLLVPLPPPPPLAGPPPPRRAQRRAQRPAHAPVPPLPPVSVRAGGAAVPHHTAGAAHGAGKWMGGGGRRLAVPCRPLEGRSLPALPEVNHSASSWTPTTTAQHPSVPTCTSCCPPPAALAAQVGAAQVGAAAAGGRLRQVRLINRRQGIVMLHQGCQEGSGIQQPAQLQAAQRAARSAGGASAASCPGLFPAPATSHAPPG